MLKSVRSKAEERFAKARKQDTQFLKEREKAQRETLEKVARLRALRLAKEAADREAAEKAAIEKAAKKTAKSSRLPNAHRQQ